MGVAAPLGRRRPPLDLLEDRLDAELVGLPVDDLVPDADDEHAAVAGLELHALDPLAEALEYLLLHVHRARQVAAGDAVVDRDRRSGVGPGVAHGSITTATTGSRQRLANAGARREAVRGAGPARASPPAWPASPALGAFRRRLGDALRLRLATQARDLEHLLLVEGLALHQGRRQPVQRGPVLGEQSQGLPVALVDDPARRLVDG